MAASMVSAKIFCWALVNGAPPWSPLSVLSLLLSPLLLLESWWDVGPSSESKSLSELELVLLELVGPDWACSGTASLPWRSWCHPGPGGIGSGRAVRWRLAASV
jgi:hypothetical protein